jgi:hypothetical protein
MKDTHIVYQGTVEEVLVGSLQPNEVLFVPNNSQTLLSLLLYSRGGEHTSYLSKSVALLRRRLRIRVFWISTFPTAGGSERSPGMTIVRIGVCQFSHFVEEFERRKRAMYWK